MKTIQEIADELGMTLKGVYSRIYTKKIKSVFWIGRTGYYQIDDFKTHITHLYYPLKTIETFYIYESKLNSPD